MSTNDLSVAGRSGPHVCGVVRVTMNGLRQIPLAAQFRLAFPHYLVEVSPVLGNTIGQWLAIFAADTLAGLDTTFQSHCDVLAVGTGDTFTMPHGACEKHALKPDDSIWLVGMGDYLEVWSDSAYQAEDARALNELLVTLSIRPSDA